MMTKGFAYDLRATCYDLRATCYELQMYRMNDSLAVTIHDVPPHQVVTHKALCLASLFLERGPDEMAFVATNPDAYDIVSNHRMPGNGRVVRFQGYS